MNSSGPVAGEGAGLWALIAILGLILTVIIHFTCLMWVLTDSAQRKKTYGATVGLGPFLWSVVALLLGPVGLAIYWVLNRSNINPQVAAACARANRPAEAASS